VDAHGKIYVTNTRGVAKTTGYVTTYESDGTQTTPTITNGLRTPVGIAVDPSGTIYVSNQSGPGNKGGFGCVTTYLADGRRTAPTITKGLLQPQLIALH
jgi:hypothetical protein